jgi:hypothetical protein
MSGGGDDILRVRGPQERAEPCWETAVYKPSVHDLEKLARFFGLNISVFFPNIEPGERIQTLLSATGDLDDEDLDELTRYALFRKARKELDQAKKKKLK